MTEDRSRNMTRAEAGLARTQLAELFTRIDGQLSLHQHSVGKLRDAPNARGGVRATQDAVAAIRVAIDQVRAGLDEMFALAERTAPEE